MIDLVDHYSCGSDYQILYIYVTLHCFFVWVFFHEHVQFTGQQVQEKAIPLTPLNHFPLASRALRYCRGDCCGELTSTHS